MASATVRADADDGWSPISDVLLRRGMGCISTWVNVSWLAAPSGVFYVLLDKFEMYRS
jgi:hypothetical protein